MAHLAEHLATLSALAERLPSDVRPAFVDVLAGLAPVAHSGVRLTDDNAGTIERFAAAATAWVNAESAAPNLQYQLRDAALDLVDSDYAVPPGSAAHARHLTNRDDWREAGRRALNLSNMLSVPLELPRPEVPAPDLSQILGARLVFADVGKPIEPPSPLPDSAQGKVPTTPTADEVSSQSPAADLLPSYDDRAAEAPSRVSRFEDAPGEPQLLRFAEMPSEVVETARGKTLADLEKLDPTVRYSWQSLQGLLQEAHWAATYDAKAWQASKDTLASFLAPGSKTRLGDVQNAMTRLAKSVIPTKDNPDRPDAQFWALYAQALHQSHLALFVTTFRAGWSQIERLGTDANSSALAFKDRVRGALNQADIDNWIKEATPQTPAPPVLETPRQGECFSDLPSSSQTRIRTEATGVLIAINDMPRSKLSTDQLRSMLDYKMIMLAYLQDRASARQLLQAACVVQTTSPLVPAAPNNPDNLRWRNVGLDARNTARLAEQLTYIRPAAEPVAARASIAR